MSEKAAKPKDSVKLNVETILQTSDGRRFLNQISKVSQVMAMRDAEVEFKGEEVATTGYVGDCKSVHLFKCPGGYFLFLNKAFSMNNWSASGELDEVLQKVDDDIRKALEVQLAEEAETAA